MANFRSNLYTAARVMGDYQQYGRFLKVKQVGGHRARRVMGQRNFYGVTQVDVGYYDNTLMPNGQLLREVAAFLEYGGKTPLGHDVPPRPFMQRANNEARKVQGGTRGMIGGAWNIDFVKPTLLTTRAGNKLGKAHKFIIQHEIFTSPSWAAPNAPSTVEGKGFDWPLVDTGFLHRNVQHKLVYGQYPNAAFSEVPSAPLSQGGSFNLRGLIYSTAKLIGDVQSLSNGQILQRVGNRAYGKVSGRVIGGVTSGDRGAAGRTQRKVAGRFVGKARSGF